MAVLDEEIDEAGRQRLSGLAHGHLRAPELIGLIIAFGILMITFGAFAAAGMPILGAIIGVSPP